VRIELSSRMESARIDAIATSSLQQKAYWHGRADGYQDSIDLLNQEKITEWSAGGTEVVRE
jgi:hypothetical protein